MKIYKLIQSEVNRGYNYQSCVVIAPDEESARKVFPRNSPNPTSVWCEERQDWFYSPSFDKSFDYPENRKRHWATHPDNVKALLIGYTDRDWTREPDIYPVICAHFETFYQ